MNIKKNQHNFHSGERLNIREFCFRAALLFMPPVTAFYLMQFIYGAWPWQTGLQAAAANILCIAAVYFLLCALTGYPAVCCVLLHICFGLWGAVNYFVSVYRGTPVLPWDLTALRTAFAVSGSYRFTPTWRMTAGILLVILLAWGLRKRMLSGRLIPGFRGAAARAAILAAGFICLGPVVQPERLTAFGIETDVWNQTEAYKNAGIVASFLKNTEFMKVEVPENLSDQYIEDAMDQAVPVPPADIPAERPSIIAIMNESWADFEEFGNLSLTAGTMDYVNSLDNAIVGHAYTSVFGAGTSTSEFEFLTGNSMAFLPSGSIPYQQYILDDTPSMASLLKEKGYQTLAFHPGEASSWQRNLAYPRLGFDRFLCGDDMDVPRTELHGYISDEADFSQIIREFENKEDGPLFLFNVTIQNHGSYTDKDYPAKVQLADCPGRYPMAEQYLTLARETDQAVSRLIEYFSQTEEPVLLVMFGDHQPSVEQEFLDRAYGVKQEDMTMEQYMGKFRVPFFIWANYPLPMEGPEETSLNFLSQYVLRYAGIETDDYGRYLWNFQKTLPALTFVGYTDAEGNAHSHLETGRYEEVIEEYRSVQYMRLFAADAASDSDADSRGNSGKETPGNTESNSFK